MRVGGMKMQFQELLRFDLNSPPLLLAKGSTSFFHLWAAWFATEHRRFCVNRLKSEVVVYRINLCILYIPLINDVK